MVVLVLVFFSRLRLRLCVTHKKESETITSSSSHRRPVPRRFSLRVILNVKRLCTNKTTMSINNSHEERRKTIRVQSVLALCERCPAIKSDRTLGFANKDTISPLPKDERIPDPVAIIAKNLSKERKHYLQKVRARGMPERFSVSLAKPRDWRKTVKVRAPKRRRLKVEEQREQQAREEHSLEQRQRQRRRLGLLERTGGGRTTTAKKKKNKKKKKNDDDDSDDDETKNSNENETATTTTKTRRKREEEGEDDTAKVTSPLIKRATKRGKIPVNFMRKKKGPSGNNAESDIDNNGGGSNNNTEEQSNNNVDGNNAKDDNTFSLNKNSNVSSETVVVESPFNKQKAGANSNGTNNKKDISAKTTTTTAVVVEGDEAAAAADALQRQREQEQEQNKNTKNPDVGRIKITVTITQKARRSQANSIRIPPTIVAVDKNATAYDLINALVITAPMHFDNGQQPTLHWDFHHVPDFSTIHGFAVGSWKVDVFEEDLTDMATLELRASPGTMIRSPALCKNAPEGFQPWLAPENLRVELDGSRDRGFAERDAITTFDRHFMKIQNYPNGSNNMHNMIGHGASDTAAGAGSGDGENNLESNTNTNNNNNNNTSNNNNNTNKKRIMKNARYYEGFIQHVNENDHNMTSQVLHPGRTSSGPMIKLLLETKSMPHAEGAGCSIVDVGSGCGNFARGIKDAFPFSSVCGIEIQKELVESSRADHGHKVTFIAGAAESELHRCVNATHILATTKNFETKTIDHIVNVAASLPLLTHLVINESRLCTTMCKVRIKSCCVFEPIETRSISTHWGNSGLDFTVYRRRTRWTENPYGHVPRGEDTARAFAERALCNDKRIHSNHHR